MSGNRRGRGDAALPFHPRGRGQGGSFTDSQVQRGRGRGDRGYGRGGGERGGRGGGGRGRGGGPEAAVFRPTGPTGVPAPDSSVARVENEMQNTLALARKKSASQKGKPGVEPRLPQRPGFGTRGREVRLWTNYFNMMVKEDLLLYRYSIQISGEQTAGGKKLKRVVQLLLQEHLGRYGHGIATDFRSNILSKTELELEEEYAVIYKAEDEDSPAANAKTYKIRLQPTGAFTVSELMDYLTSSQASQLFGSKEEMVQTLNIVVGHYPKDAAHILSVGANKHFRLDSASSERLDLGAGLTALRGFFVSVRAATARILLNVQVKHGAFFDEGPLDKLMQAFMHQNGPSKVKLAKFVNRLSVDVIHIVRQRRDGRRIMRRKVIVGVAMRDDGRGQEHPPIVPEYGAGSKEVKFYLTGSPKTSKPQASGGPSAKKASSGPSSQGKYISVFDYFTQTYPKFKIQQPGLPVVNVGSRKNPSYLPPEVCVVLPGQPANSKLSASQTQQMIRFAVRRPAQNARSIVTDGKALLGFDPNNPTLDAFGINVVPTLITVPGRVLDSPVVKYHNKPANTRFGGWNMVDVQFATRAKLTNWTYLWISGQGSRDPWDNNMALKSTIDAFTGCLRKAGVHAADCTPGMRISVSPDTAESQINEAIHRFTSTPGKVPPKLILVLIPFIDSVMYKTVKYACDVREGLLNVCVLAEKFARANEQYHMNVALKVNLKLGGQNQFLDNSKLGIVAEGKTMVVGIDVTHPAPGSSSNAPSVASIVASVDQWLAQWPADLRIQTGRQEMVADLEALFKSRLRLWHTKHRVYPENILVYRDGVSEGQYDLVLDQELPLLRKACKELYPASDTKKNLPRVTIIIVGKRHNTRFYPTKAEDADRSSNPQNGTVVDRGVTEACNWDFFLQAHTALQGTARPAHYYIVYDEIFQAGRVPPPFASTADVVEDLTHNLCYLFGRATKAVSCCTPAYYADLACERARCYLGGLLDSSSSDSPAASVVSGAGQVADPNRVRIHDRVKDSMFYL